MASIFDVWLKHAFGADSAEIGGVLGATGVIFALSNIFVVGRVVTLAPETRLLVAAIGTVAVGRFSQAACATTRQLLLAQVPVRRAGCYVCYLCCIL